MGKVAKSNQMRLPKHKQSIGRLSGSSILEVVVAMVVIVTVLGIALAIYSNVVRSSLSAQRLRAQAVLSKRMDVLAHSGDTTHIDTTDTLIEGWHLQQQLQPYGSSAKLQQVHLLLLDNNQDTLAQLRQVIIANPGRITNNNIMPNESTAAR